MLKLYLIRHGETEYNRKGIIQGGGIDSDLNEAGHEQARAFFEAYRHIRFDALYASALKRTHQTLAPWRDAGFSFEGHADINEFSWGEHEGLQPTEELRREFKAVIRRWQEGDWHASIRGGETPTQAWERSKRFLDLIRQRHNNQQILVCSHGRQLRIVLNKLLGIDMEDPVIHPHGNTALNLLHLHPDGRTEAILLNNVRHLERQEVER